MFNKIKKLRRIVVVLVLSSLIGLFASGTASATTVNQSNNERSKIVKAKKSTYKSIRTKTIIHIRETRSAKSKTLIKVPVGKKMKVAKGKSVKGYKKASYKGVKGFVSVKQLKKKPAKRTKIVQEAKKHKGVKYRSGGSNPRTGFDCSGFVSYVYSKATNKKLPRTSSGMSKIGKRVPKKAAKAGDIIWTPGHVAIYLGDDMQIDAPKPGQKIKVRKIWQRNPTFISVL